MQDYQIVWVQKWQQTLCVDILIDTLEQALRSLYPFGNLTLNSGTYLPPG